MEPLPVAPVPGSVMTIFGDAEGTNSPQEIPDVPTPVDVVNQMLDSAGVKMSDLLYELGSGAGRIVIRGAELYVIRAAGVEIDRKLLAKARQTAETAGVTI